MCFRPMWKVKEVFYYFVCDENEKKVILDIYGAKILFKIVVGKMSIFMHRRRKKEAKNSFAFLIFVFVLFWFSPLPFGVSRKLPTNLNDFNWRIHSFYVLKATPQKIRKKKSFLVHTSSCVVEGIWLYEFRKQSFSFNLKIQLTRRGGRSPYLPEWKAYLFVVEREKSRVVFKRKMPAF